MKIQRISVSILFLMGFLAPLGFAQTTAREYVKRAYAAEDKGLYDEATSNYTKAIELNPNDDAAYNNRAVAYRHKGQYDQAISDGTKAIELKPDDATNYHSRGLTYSDKGQYDQAISDYTKAIEIDPYDGLYYENRGIAYARKGRYDQAISDCDKAIEQLPRPADAYLNRGNATPDTEDWCDKLSKAPVDKNLPDGYSHPQISLTEMTAAEPGLAACFARSRSCYRSPARSNAIRFRVYQDVAAAERMTK